MPMCCRECTRARAKSPHLYGQPFDRPQSRSNSSSLPQEAIRAEVARQLAGFDQRAQAQELEIQRLRRQLEEERVMRDQAVEVFRAPAQSAASAGRGLLSSLWSGIGASATWTNVWQHGSNNPTRKGMGLCHQAFPTQEPMPQVHHRLLRHQTHAHRKPALPEVQPRQPCQEAQQHLNALVLGMQQLQTLLANQPNTPKKEDAPESVKTGITALPKLAPPDPSGGSLDFQDWLQQISGLMSDFSDSSQGGGQR